MKPKNGFSDNTRKERSQIRRITMSNRTGKETGTQWKWRKLKIKSTVGTGKIPWKELLNSSHLKRFKLRMVWDTIFKICRVTGLMSHLKEERLLMAFMLRDWMVLKVISSHGLRKKKKINLIKMVLMQKLRKKQPPELMQNSLPKLSVLLKTEAESKEDQRVENKRARVMVTTQSTKLSESEISLLMSRSRMLLRLWPQQLLLPLLSLLESEKNVLL